MPGGPDYPHDQSTRYPLSVRKGISNFRANGDIQGIIHTSEGDIRTWVIAGCVQASAKNLITALAYLEVADRMAVDHDALEAQRMAETKSEVSALRSEVQQLRTEVNESGKLVQALVGFLGVIVPNWHTRAEVENGDEMGLTIPSAESIGLVVEFVPLQLEPGFEHEEIVSMEPPAGSLVARESSVRVHINLMG